MPQTNGDMVNLATIPNFKQTLFLLGKRNTFSFMKLIKGSGGTHLSCEIGVFISSNGSNILGSEAKLLMNTLRCHVWQLKEMGFEGNKESPVGKTAHSISETIGIVIRNKIDLCNK